MTFRITSNLCTREMISQTTSEKKGDLLLVNENYGGSVDHWLT